MVIKKYRLFKSLAFTFFCVAALFLAENAARADDAVSVSLSQSPLQASSVIPIAWKTVRVDRDMLSFEGLFRRKGAIRNWVVLWEDQEWKISDDRRIRFEIPYDPAMKTLELTLTGAAGQVEYHFYHVNFHSFAAEEAREKKEAERREKEERDRQAKEAQDKQKSESGTGGGPDLDLIRRIRFEPGFAFAQTSFEQTNVALYQSTDLVVNAFASLKLAPRWDLGAGFDFTVVNIFRSHIPQNRIFNYNMHVGYYFTEIEQPWTLFLRGGWFYHTLITTSADYGYSNFSGPMLQPTVKRRLTSENEASFTIKYGLITDRFKILGSDIALMGFGFSYSLPFEGRETTIKLDYSQVTAKDSGLNIRTRSWTLGAVIAF